MQWEKFGQNKIVGKKSVPVRSLRILDEVGIWRRYRICTVWDFNAEKFTPTPAVAKLVKDEQKRIGILITGMHAGSVKIGKRMGVQQYVFTSFNTISKKVKRSLLFQVSCEFFEEDDLILGREIGENLNESK